MVNATLDRNQVAQDCIDIFAKHGIPLPLDEALKLADIGIKTFQKVEVEKI